MDIKTEFSLKDKVYLIYEGKIKSGIIHNIEIDINYIKEVNIVYLLKNIDNDQDILTERNEKLLGKTIEELVNKISK